MILYLTNMISFYQMMADLMNHPTINSEVILDWLQDIKRFPSNDPNDPYDASNEDHKQALSLIRAYWVQKDLEKADKARRLREAEEERRMRVHQWPTYSTPYTTPKEEGEFICFFS
jgi:hypothetical protein